MSKKFLLTSFQTWLPHQKSNSADDLLKIISNDNFPHISFTLIRKLPVNIVEASFLTIQEMKTQKPEVIICCGMAEKRQYLTLESKAIWKDKKIATSVNLEEIITRLSNTKISNNAGKFVCEGLYYRVLSYQKKHLPNSKIIFVHVPILHENNQVEICQDFRQIINYFGQ
jgi:pyroglutamyl-peptidase